MNLEQVISTSLNKHLLDKYYWVPSSVVGKRYLDRGDTALRKRSKQYDVSPGVVKEKAAVGGEVGHWPREVREGIWRRGCLS